MTDQHAARSRGTLPCRLASSLGLPGTLVSRALPECRSRAARVLETSCGTAWATALERRSICQDCVAALRSPATGHAARWLEQAPRGAGQDTAAMQMGALPGCRSGPHRLGHRPRAAEHPPGMSGWHTARPRGTLPGGFACSARGCLGHGQIDGRRCQGTGAGRHRARDWAPHCLVHRPRAAGTLPECRGHCQSAAHAATLPECLDMAAACRAVAATAGEVAERVAR